MNKLVLVVLLAVLAGGGWYVYTNNNAQVSTDVSGEDLELTYLDRSVLRFRAVQ